MAKFYTATDEGLRTNIYIKNNNGHDSKIRVLVTAHQKVHFSFKWPFIHKASFWNIAFTNVHGHTINAESDTYPPAYSLVKRYHAEGESMINALLYSL